MKKCLILFASRTGNTEKVAKELKKCFEEAYWAVDFVKYDMVSNPINLSIDYDAYDFICLGSPVYWYVPHDPMLQAIRKTTHTKSYSKIIPGPKKALAFATYSGAHLGPREAEACLKLLEITYEHLGFESAGAISIPGKYPNRPTPELYHPDLYLRPNEDDLNRVSEFVKKIIDCCE